MTSPWKAKPSANARPSFCVVAVIGAVVAVDLIGGGDVQDVVDVVVPLRGIEPGRAASVAGEQRGTIVLVLEDQMDVAVRRCAANPLRQLGQQMQRSLVADRVDGVEPQAVEMKFLHPVEGIVDEKVAHRAEARDHPY